MEPQGRVVHAAELPGAPAISPSTCWAAWQFALSQHFAKRGEDKFQNVVHAPGLGGCPLLFGALATFECSKEANVVGGDHVVFFGRIERATYREGEPLIFSAGKYGTHSPLE